MLGFHHHPPRTHYVFYCFRTALHASRSPVLANGYTQELWFVGGKKKKCWRKDGGESVAQERCDKGWVSRAAGVTVAGAALQVLHWWIMETGPKTPRSPSAQRGVVWEERSAATMETLHLLLISQKAKRIRPARNVTLRNKKGTSHTGQMSENPPGKTHQGEWNWRPWKITRWRLVLNLGFARLV